MKAIAEDQRNMNEQLKGKLDDRQEGLVRRNCEWSF
jgi:hypothetical protein